MDKAREMLAFAERVRLATQRDRHSGTLRDRPQGDDALDALEVCRVGAVRAMPVADAVLSLACSALELQAR
jgi:hypothetical protein